MCFSKSSRRIGLVILTELFESVLHGNDAAIIFEEIQRFALNPDFHDGIDSIALLCSNCTAVERKMNMLSMPIEDAGQGYTTNLIEMSSLLLRKANSQIKDACSSNE
jgi:hypothetical protein